MGRLLAVPSSSVSRVDPGAALQLSALSTFKGFTT